VKTEHEGVRIPRILFTKGGGLWLDEIADAGADVVGLDWTMNLAKARAQVGGRVALQGNLDPNVLFAPEAAIREQVRSVLDSFGVPGPDSGHVFNLGHGISQHTPPEAVTVLVDEVHAHSRRQRNVK
jgi:uroporphyrinogen decarboxylase